MSGVFSQVMKETSSPFSPSAPLRNTTSEEISGALTGAAGLAQEFLTYKSGRYEKQDAREFQRQEKLEDRAYREQLGAKEDAREDAIRSERFNREDSIRAAGNQRADLIRQEGYERQDSVTAGKRLYDEQARIRDASFISGLGQEISNIREATLQGKQTKLVEAARIRRAQVKALQQRGDLNSEIFSLDNEIAGFSAGDIESEELHADENLAQEVVNSAIKANPFLVVYNKSGTIDRAATFQRASAYEGHKQDVQRTKDQYALQLQALQGAKLEGSIAQEQETFLKARATERLVQGHRALAKDTAIALMDTLIKSKRQGDFDPQQARVVLAENIANAESVVRDDLTQLGIYDKGEVASILGQVTSDLESLVNLENVGDEALQMALRSLQTRQDLSLAQTLGPIASITRNPALSRAIFDNPALKFSEESIQVGEDISTKTIQGISAYLNGSTGLGIPLSAEQGATMTPIVQSVLADKSTETNRQGAYALGNWTQSLNTLTGSGPVAVAQNIEAIELLTTPQARGKLNSIAKTDPELFNQIAPSLNTTISKGFQHYASQLIKIQGANKAPWFDVEMKPNGDLKIKRNDVLTSTEAYRKARLDAGASERQIELELEASPSFKSSETMINPVINNSVTKWNQFRVAASDIMTNMGLDEKEQYGVFQAYGVGLLLKTPRPIVSTGPAGSAGSEGPSGGEAATPFPVSPINSQTE